MSFFLDIAQGNTGGFCWYDVSGDPLAKPISPGLALGLTPGKRRAKYETASRDRHHLPALHQTTITELTKMRGLPREYITLPIAFKAIRESRRAQLWNRQASIIMDLTALAFRQVARKHHNQRY